MLSKLMKHEFKQTGKIFLPMFGGMLILIGITSVLLFVNSAIDTSSAALSEANAMGGASGVASISGAANSDETTIIGGADGSTAIFVTSKPVTIFSVISGVFLSISIFALVAFLTAVFLVSVLRFYKNLLGDEGYLMFTLPVTAAQNIWAKMIVAVTWVTGAVVLAVGAAVTFSASAGANYDGIPIWTMLGEQFYKVAAQYGVGVYLAPIFLLVLIIVAFASAFLMIYLAMAIGAQWMQSRLLASVVSFFCLQTLLQILGFIGIIAFGFLFQHQVVAMMQGMTGAQIVAFNPLTLLGILWAVALVVALVLGAVFFLITQHLLTKKLNLA